MISVREQSNSTTHAGAGVMEIDLSGEAMSQSDASLETGWPTVAELSLQLIDELQNSLASADASPDERVRLESDRNVTTRQRYLKDLLGELVVALDREIGRQLSVVMTHPLFMRLEAVWRGIESIVCAQEKYAPQRVGADCVVQMVDCSPRELMADLASQSEFTNSWLFNRIYNQTLDTRGGEPFSLLVSSMEFGGLPHHAKNLHFQPWEADLDRCGIDLLHRIAQVAQYALCPFVAAASPALLGLSDFSGLAKLAHLQMVNTKPASENGGRALADQWDRLRRDPASRFIGLVAPRIVLAGSLDQRYSRMNWFGWPALTRQPQDREIARLSFKPLLGSGALALAGAVIRSVFSTGWPSMIMGVSSNGDGVEDIGGLVVTEGDSFPTDPKGVSVRAPLEVAMTGEQEVRLGEMGLIALSRINHTHRAAFYTLRMAYLPQYSDRKTDNSTQELHSILPYILIASRFAQFAKIHLWRQHGKLNSREEIQTQLDNLLGGWRGTNIPLSDAIPRVVDEGNGTYSCHLSIVPRLMADDVSIDGVIALKLIVSGKPQSMVNPPEGLAI